MSNFLSGLGNFLGPAVGVGGQAQGASNNAWQYGQYQPFNVNNPAGQISFNGTTANAGLSPQQAQLQNLFSGQINSNFANGATNYNPNTGFLPSQYQSIYGNFNNNVNQQFGNLMAAQQPQINQYLNSNLTNEFAKGTLASTAGGYQTYGADQAVNSLMSNNYNQAFGQASNLANQQMGAASNTANLMEQQAQFAPQLATQQNNSAMSNMLGQNNMLSQLMGQAGNMGAQRSGANVAAATPGIMTGAMNDQASSGFLNGLLFGGGTTGNLMNQLLGSGNSGLSGALASALGLGNSVGNMGGGTAGGSASDMTNGSYNGGAFGGGAPLYDASTGGYPGGAQASSYDPSLGINTTSSGAPDWLAGTGFNSAGGEAAAPSASTSSSGLGELGTLGTLGGIASGLAKGGALGDLQAAGGIGSLYNRATGNTGGFGGLLGQAGQALNIYNGLTSGTPQGVVGGLASGAQLGASSGAASALGASSGTVAALGAAGTGVGAILAMPQIVNGIVGLFSGIGGQGGNPSQGILESTPGSGWGMKDSAPGVTQGSFGLGSIGIPTWNGDYLFNVTKDQANKAVGAYNSGNTQAYDAYMQSLVKDLGNVPTSEVYNPITGQFGPPTNNATPKPQSGSFGV